MESSQEKNKRIAKNTLFLYFRQMITMGVSLYTSRIVLATLGISDYGINNIVGGLIGYFTFLNISMSAATRRFLAFELGTGNKEKLKQVFQMSVNIYFIIIGITILLAETIGLWFLNNKLNIPSDRMIAANVIYQFSIFSTCISLLGVPYNSALFANEKFSFFARMSILDVLFKLGIVYLLVYISYDKLILLSGLWSVVGVIVFFCYKIYCNKKFEETFYKPIWNKQLFVEIFSYSGWTLLGAISWVLLTTTMNTLLNIFYGVKVNAAFGVANQVSLAVASFVNNFSTAFSPQITKAYAEKDNIHLNNLIIRGTKFSYYLLFIVAVPVIINLDFILSLWLKEVPEYAVDFCKLILISFMISVFYDTPNMLINATGNIKTPQKANFILCFLAFLITYAMFKLNFSVLLVGYMYIAYRILYVLMILYFASFLEEFSLKIYLGESFLPCLLVTCLSLPLPMFIKSFTFGWQALFLSCGSFFIIGCIIILFIGMNKREREFVFKAIRNRIKF